MKPAFLRKATAEFRTSGYFALRTPFLPLEELWSWTGELRAPATQDDRDQLEEALDADRRSLRGRLRELFSRREIVDALFVASPSLYDELDEWFKDSESKAGQRAECVFVRYLVRMASRPTPFGLFAGCSSAPIGMEDRLRLKGRAVYRRHTRLDMDYLYELTRDLGRDREIRRGLSYRPNTSLYVAAGRPRYVEARTGPDQRTHHLVAVEPAEHLSRVLDAARGGASRDVLAGALLEWDPDLPRDEAESYVDTLIDNQVLISDLEPPLTGREPVHDLVATLRTCPGTERVVAILREAQGSLEAIDQSGAGVDPARYLSVAKALEALPTTVSLPRLFQIDLTKETDAAGLSAGVIEELLLGVEYLHRWGRPTRRDYFARFRKEFVDRYGGRAVPLVEALDEEIGIGFERSKAPEADASTLLAGLYFPPDSVEPAPWTPRESFLLRRLEQAWQEKATEIRLTPEEIERFGETDPPALPDAFAIMATVVADSEESMGRGDFRVLLHNAYGPPGAVLLGRFCHADANLHRLVEKDIRAEEALHPEAVFAEIVHLPQGRVGNILCRPVMRDYEIPYLGRSGAAATRQLPITDLYVSVEEEQVVLRSASLGREVIPRLTSAHDFTQRSVGLYRFLCTHQHQQGGGGLVWYWGQFQAARFLPRVVCGRVVLSRAAWLLDSNDVKLLAERNRLGTFELVQDWRRKRQIPRLVLFADFDNELLVDLDNIVSIEAFVPLAKEQRGARLVEFFPDAEQQIVQGPEGHYAHELIVPFIRARPAPSQPRLHLNLERRPRSYPPDSEWLYYKIYSGTSCTDQVLTRAVGPVVRDCLAAGLADRWFFVRHEDPDLHLRVRLHGDPEVLGTRVLPALRSALTPFVEQGWVWRIQLDTYEPEVDRYGGRDGMEVAERIFHVDSDAVLELLPFLEGDEGANWRWKLAFWGTDRLLDCFGLDSDEKATLLRELRAKYGKEFSAHLLFFRYQLADRLRKDRPELLTLLDTPGAAESAHPGAAVLRARSERLEPLVAELRALEADRRLSVPWMQLTFSFVHMHMIRLLRSHHRAHELVLYDFLDQLYRSKRARKAKSGSVGRT